MTPDKHAILDALADKPEPDHFHGCPHCPPERGPDNVYNEGRHHTGACHEHRTTWDLGSNLFSSWRQETEAEQRERWREIENYTAVNDRPRQQPERDDAIRALADGDFDREDVHRLLAKLLDDAGVEPEVPF